jgi:hypothetical protein
MKNNSIHNGKVLPIIWQLRDKNLTVSQIAIWSNLSTFTIRSIINGNPCSPLTYQKLQKLLDDLTPKSFWTRLARLFGGN